MLPGLVHRRNRIGLWITGWTLSSRDFRYPIPFRVQLDRYISLLGCSFQMVSGVIAGSASASWRVNCMNPPPLVGVAVMVRFLWFGVRAPSDEKKALPI